MLTMTITITTMIVVAIFPLAYPTGRRKVVQPYNQQGDKAMSRQTV